LVRRDGAGRVSISANAFPAGSSPPVELFSIKQVPCPGGLGSEDTCFYQLKSSWVADETTTVMLVIPEKVMFWRRESCTILQVLLSRRCRFQTGSSCSRDFLRIALHGQLIASNNDRARSPRSSFGTVENNRVVYPTVPWGRVSRDGKLHTKLR
jgi:hypothetical protein